MAKKNTGRRGHGEGSITQRKDGRWVGRLDLGYENGKRKVKDFYGQTQKEVVDKLTKARRDLQQGLPVAVERQTVGGFIEEWLTRGPELLNIRPSTHNSYCFVARSYLVPTLGRIQLLKLTARELNSLYASLLKDGKSARTVQYAHSVLHRILKDAARMDLIPRNPADLVDAPRAAKKELTPPDHQQLVAFLDAAKKDRLHALYVLAITCGLREGELLGLKWPDLNLEAAELQVRRTVYRVKGQGWVVNEPKTAKGRRMIALPDVAVEALRRHRVAQLEERLAAGPTWKDNGWMFPNTEGTLMERQNLVQRCFKPLLEKAGMPATTRFHDLRHAMATMMLEDGAHPKVVQERLGHATISVTLDTYSHVKPKLQREAAAKFDERFS
ncbi:MAG TPA: site-specific integrase [Candidatus Xenobia bacterium]